MNRQSVERRFSLRGRGVRAAIAKRCTGAGTPTFLRWLHHQTVDQVQAGADFVVAGVSRTAA